MGLWAKVYADDDPNGASLGTLERVLAAEVRMALFPDLGGGKVSISRTDAQAGLLSKGRYLKVGITEVHASNPIWGVWLLEGRDELLAVGEEVEEVLTWGGSGPMLYLSDAKLWYLAYAGDAGPRADLKWHWPGATNGAIALRLVDEAQARSPDLLAALTVDFTSTDDSDSVAWPDYAGEVLLDIGADYVAAMRLLTAGGQLQPIMSPDLLLSGYVNYGRDLTGAFGAATVRFEKGINILTGLAQDVVASRDATHALTGGSDGQFAVSVRPGWAAGDTRRETFVAAGELTDPADLALRGTEELRRKEDQAQSFEVGFLVGDDPANGFYLPGDHLLPGDYVTLDDGTTERTERVYAIRLVMRDADGPGDPGIDAVAELSAGASSGEEGGAGAGESLGDDPCGCGPGSQVPPPHPAPECQPSGAVLCEDNADPGGHASFFSGDCGGSIVHPDGALFWSNFGGGDRFCITDPGSVTPGEPFRFEVDSSWTRPAGSTLQVHWLDNTGTQIGAGIVIDTIPGCSWTMTDEQLVAPALADHVALYHTGALGTALYTNVRISGPLVDNDPFCLPEGTAGSSPYYARPDDIKPAEQIGVEDTGGDYTATDAEGVFAEIAAALASIGGGSEAHIADASDAHDASAVSFVPTGPTAATDTQAAIVEVAADAAAALAGHAAAAVTLDSLTDVVVTSPVAADRLRYDGSTWVNSDLHWEPMVDYTGLVMLDSAGNPSMHEVAH